MTSAEFATYIAAMFTILNPIGNTALFAGLVTVPEERRPVAIKCALAIIVILVGSIWAGEAVLGFFGVSIASLEGAGGILIAMIGLSMLQSKENAVHSTGTHESRSAKSIAIVPLAMPIVAGPGAIATVIIYSHKYTGVTSNLEMSAVCIGMAVLICICFMCVGWITRLLGDAGIKIVTKFMGLILLAIAIGMLGNAAKTLLPGLAG